MMKSDIHDIRKKLEERISEMGANWHGAGTNMITGVVDFSFGLDGKTYSVHVEELKKG